MKLEFWFQMLIQKSQTVTFSFNSNMMCDTVSARLHMRICAYTHTLYIDSARTRARETLFVIKITNKNLGKPCDWAINFVSALCLDKTSNHTSLSYLRHFEQASESRNPLNRDDTLALTCFSFDNTKCNNLSCSAWFPYRGIYRTQVARF